MYWPRGAMAGYDPVVACADAPCAAPAIVSAKARPLAALDQFRFSTLAPFIEASPTGELSRRDMSTGAKPAAAAERKSVTLS